MKHETLSLPRGEHFFTRDRSFYTDWLRLFLLLAFQNIITYSVNVADNVMLGAYDQTALSGAAAVNQIQYILQSVISSGLGDGLVVLGAQLWGKRDTDTLQKLGGTALVCGWSVGLLLTAAAFVLPEKLVALFTSDPAIIAEGTAYLQILRWSYLVFITTSVILCVLRSVQIAGIAFRLSVMTLIVNVGINRVLIFGMAGIPAMGIRGAAIGTLAARILELAVLLCWCLRKGHLPFTPRLHCLFRWDPELLKRYAGVSLPCLLSALLFSGSVSAQTVIMGHLNADAIAASSAAGTLFQYCKMIPIGAAAATGVIIGRTIGSGDLSPLRSYVRTAQVMFIGIGMLFGLLLKLISGPILSMYALSDQALAYAAQMVTVMSLTSICTGYQMPCMVGIVRGGGDARFVMLQDMVFPFIVVPLSYFAAFRWNWSIPLITLCLNVDQILKVPLVTWKIRSMTWIRSLTGPKT